MCSGWVPCESRLVATANGLETCFYVTQLEAQEFERQRGIEAGPGEPYPVVECVLGPADRRGTAARHQPDPLGFLAAQRLVRQQVVARLCETAQQRPDDDGVISSGDSEAGMAVEDF